MMLFTAADFPEPAAVLPSLFLMSERAPFFTRKFTMPACPFELAMCSGVLPLLFCVFILVPRCTRTSTVWKCPFAAAWCRGVQPSSLCESHRRQAPISSSSFTIGVFPLAAAQGSGFSLALFSEEMKRGFHFPSARTTDAWPCDGRGRSAPA